MFCEKILDSIDEFEEIYLDFIAEKQVFYAELPHRLTRHQFSTTKAIASFGMVEGVTLWNSEEKVIAAN